MRRRLRVLHLEDDPHDAELVARALAESGLEVDSSRVATEAAFLSAIESSPDVVIADYALPQFNAPVALRLLKARWPDVPFIIVSGTIGEEKATEVLRLGADDYLLKDRLARLPSAVENAVSAAEQRTAQKQAERSIRRLTRVYAMLSGINSAILRIRDRQELVEETCRIATSQGQFAMAWVGLVDPEAMVVKPVASAGKVGDFFRTAPLAIVETAPGGHGLAGRAVRELRPVISNDVANDPQRLMKGELAERGINSIAVIPLVVGVQAIGVLALYATDVGAFDDDEMRLLIDLAGDVSFALDHIDKANRLQYLAYYDPLTGLANRNLFLERLEQKIISARATQRKLAVSIVDVERFKTINDALGRRAGDELLKQIGERMQGSGPDPTRVARIGADHFAIFSAELDNEDDVGRLTEHRLNACFALPFRLDGEELRVSARVGIAIFPNDGDDAEALFANAEAALKRAKATGERYLFFAPAMTNRVHESLSLENKLRQALEKEEFVLHYQPKVRLLDRRIVGVEALIRWRSADLGLVPPGQFIPLMEATGLILQVGSWALQRASLDYRRLRQQMSEPPRIAVNVSAVQLRQRDFVATVEQAIGADATSGIDLEITESLAMEDVNATIEKLGLMRRFGVNVVIDDFGTGYSSLGYLAKLPIQSLKIDRSFIAALTGDRNATTLVSTIISLAHSLQLTVVAEGVETEDQVEVLRRLGCDQMQGYVFSKPLPFDELSAFLRH
jgi:diguanylate cyclase (GGDEF)-like protein